MKQHLFYTLCFVSLFGKIPAGPFFHSGDIIISAYRSHGTSSIFHKSIRGEKNPTYLFLVLLNRLLKSNWYSFILNFKQKHLKNFSLKATHSWVYEEQTMSLAVNECLQKHSMFRTNWTINREVTIPGRSTITAKLCFQPSQIIQEVTVIKKSKI